MSQAVFPFSPPSKVYLDQIELKVSERPQGIGIHSHQEDRSLWIRAWAAHVSRDLEFLEGR